MRTTWIRTIGVIGLLAASAAAAAASFTFLVDGGGSTVAQARTEAYNEAQQMCSGTITNFEVVGATKSGSLFIVTALATCTTP